MIRNLSRKITTIPSFKMATTTMINNEYNFYVDFKGLLYFDDGTPFLYPNSIKDVKFISYLYKNLKESKKQGYPYEAEFWGERNFVRYAISPVIYNYIDNQGNLRFSFEQKHKFTPQALQIDKQGRIWHPFRDSIKGVFSNDLIANSLQQVETIGDKTTFKFKGHKYQIKQLTQ